MMHNSRLIPHVVHELQLPAGGHVALVAENGIDILFFVLHRVSRGEHRIVVNDQFGGQWGEELIVAMPGDGGADRDRLWFKLEGGRLELWNRALSTRFDRFDAGRAGRVRFVRLHEASNPGRSLVFETGSLDAALADIDSHLLHRRLRAIEEHLGLAAGKPVAAEEPPGPVQLRAKGGG